MTTPVDLPVKIGAVLANKYRIDRILGTGAMGAVVAAEHLELGELRAIKFMLPNLATKVSSIERFLREARAASRLRSHHVTQIYDVDRLESGLPYIVMEMLTGSDLKSVLHGSPQLSIDLAICYVNQACEAIGEAHALGIVHRDIKPANLFLTKGPRGDDCIKVLDFGIAKILDSAAPLTGTHEAFGTPLYMSPEQIRATRETDERTDVWSLGVLLFRMLTGTEPFRGATLTAVCSAVLNDAPVRPSSIRSDIPETLEGIVLRCLSKEPTERFANAIELRNALEQRTARGSASKGSIRTTSDFTNDSSDSTTKVERPSLENPETATADAVPTIVLANKIDEKRQQSTSTEILTVRLPAVSEPAAHQSGIPAITDAESQSETVDPVSLPLQTNHGMIAVIAASLGIAAVIFLVVVSRKESPPLHEPSSATIHVTPTAPASLASSPFIKSETTVSLSPQAPSLNTVASAQSNPTTESSSSSISSPVLTRKAIAPDVTPKSTASAAPTNPYGVPSVQKKPFEPKGL